jgi:hypothetical protein
MNPAAAPVSAPPRPVPFSPVAAPQAAAARDIPAPDISSQPAPPPPPSTKPLVVGGWWKFGAGTADLQSAADACTAKLDPADAPGAGLHSVTPALYGCLRGGGWHGLARAQN